MIRSSYRMTEANTLAAGVQSYLLKCERAYVLLVDEARPVPAAPVILLISESETVDRYAPSKRQYWT